MLEHQELVSSGNSCSVFTSPLGHCVQSCALEKGCACAFQAVYKKHLQEASAFHTELQ